MHGDLGRVGPDDVLLMLSNSGETAEIVNLLPSLQKLGVKIISMMSQLSCTLARNSTVALDYGRLPEACALGLAPTTSTTMMMALGDALVLTLANLRQFRAIDFAKFHPGGSLGKKLSTVNDIMRPIEQCRVAHEAKTVREVYIESATSHRRVGVILLTDDDGKLTGLFTDSDLGRILEAGDDSRLSQPISEVMTRKPFTVRSKSKTQIAVEILAAQNISELPVVNSSGCPIGILDITDVVNLFPVEK